MDKLR
jgi:hypothetical protein